MFYHISLSYMFGLLWGFFLSAGQSLKKRISNFYSDLRSSCFFIIHYFRHFWFWIAFRTLDGILSNVVNINLIYTNRLCVWNRNFIADGYHCTVLCTVTVTWLMEEEQQAPYELHCIPDSIIHPLGGYIWLTFTRFQAFISQNIHLQEKVFFHIATGSHQLLRKVP